MKKITVLGLAAAACVIVAGTAMGAVGDNTKTAGTTAYILKPLLLSDSDSLDFGSWATNENACTVTITGDVGTDGGHSGAPCVYFSTPQSADDSDWTITGEAGKPYTLTLTGVTTLGPVTACGGGPTTIPKPFDWTFVGQPTGGPIQDGGFVTGTLTSGLAEPFAVGASISIDGQQCPGSYAGFFTLTATY